MTALLAKDEQSTYRGGTTRAWLNLKVRHEGDRVGARKFVTAAAQRIRVGELLDRLMADYALRGRRATATNAAHLKPIRAAFAHRRAVDVKAQHIAAYMTERLAVGKAPATINREVQRRANRSG
jgi:hypothetical protein